MDNSTVGLCLYWVDLWLGGGMGILDRMSEGVGVGVNVCEWVCGCVCEGVSVCVYVCVNGCESHNY